MLLKQRLFAYGTPDQVMHPELLSQVYEGKLLVFATMDGDSSASGDES